MFDIGFWELCLISVVALLILGPERLPVAARTAGLWIGKAKRMIGNVKSEIDRELQLDELRNRLKEEEIKIREDSGLDDLEDMAENSIANLKSFQEDLDSESRVSEDDEHHNAELNESGHGEYEPDNDISSNPEKPDTTTPSDKATIDNNESEASDSDSEQSNFKS